MSHQVFEQSCKLFHQTGELDEGGPQVRAVPAHEVTPELVQSLSVILLILHMLCEEEKKNTHGSTLCIYFTPWCY